MSTARRTSCVTLALALVMGAAAFLTRPVRAETTTIEVSADVHTNERHPERDLVVSKELRVDGAPGKVAYLQFEGASELDGAVSLELLALEAHPGFEARAVTAEWSETSVSWSEAPEIADSPSVASGPLEAGEWVSIDVAELVGPDTHGIALVTTEEEAAVLSSSEGDQAPRLVLGEGSVGSVPEPNPTETVEPTPLPTETPGPAPTEPPPSGSGQASWKVETPAVRGSGDIADDPTIWVNKSDPAQSLVIGTNKHNSSGGMHVYSLDGKELQYLPTGKMNNADVRYGFPLGGAKVDLVAATNRTKDTIDFFSVSTAKRLEPVGSVASGITVYGSCMYQSKSGKYYAFATSEQGQIEQFEIQASGSSVSGHRVRAFNVGSDTEGCVADDATGDLYIGEERVGIWKYGAEPAAGDARKQVDSVGSGHLTADVEGLTIYYGAGGAGYLIASSQGDSTFAVYDRVTNAYLGSFEINGGSGDPVTETDGIDVTSAALGASYPGGLFVVHDASNSGTSNFKLVEWSAVAAAAGLTGQGASGSSTQPASGTAPSSPPQGAEPPAAESVVSTNVLTSSCQASGSEC